MRENPDLKVLVGERLLRPGHALLRHRARPQCQELDQSLCGNISFRYYPSGHMVYLNPEARKAFRADLADFYDSAATPVSSDK